MKDIEYKGVCYYSEGKSNEVDVENENVYLIVEKDGVKIYRDDNGDYVGECEGVWYVVNC